MLRNYIHDEALGVRIWLDKEGAIVAVQPMPPGREADALPSLEDLRERYAEVALPNGKWVH